ncbi:helix-turn-helix domain-containing protein [Aequorivita capsosiphonis]|uniref:helix-turn-helix domain-containing protein n=1 Tax=Aequorivita capsosiphonis TaxID=487317 RepID=UPI0003F50A67|nr:AraC family transcriptional regulator [Aequorivita capsosiphonis]
MRSVCTIWFLLFFCVISVAQQDNTSGLLKQAEDALYSDPQEAIRIAEYISEKSDQPTELLQASYILTRAFYMEGKYDQALKIGLKFSEKELKGDTDIQIHLNILLSKILNDLYLNALSSYYNQKSYKLLNENSESNAKSWVEGKIIQYSINKDQPDSTKRNLEHYYQAKNKFKGLSPKNYSFQIGNINLDLAQIHLREFQLDSAEVYLATALQESRKKESGNYLEMKALIDYGNLIFLKNAHTKAIDTLNAAMKIAEKFQNLPEQITISHAIAENYLVLNNLNEFNNYNQKAADLNTARGENENDAVNVAYNIFNKNEAAKYDLARANATWYLLILGGILFLLLLFWGFTKLRYRAKINQYQKFIGYLEQNKEKEIVKVAPTKKLDLPRTLNIPKEAEDILLKKLNTFENSLDFTNNDISLSRLALQFETNTKYLSEIVNTHKQKNFNTYINELRISYIIEKLKTDPQYLQYKISYLAKDSGFSSHSVFATVFKSVTGISPTTFISLLQNKLESPAA